MTLIVSMEMIRANINQLFAAMPCAVYVSKILDI